MDETYRMVGREHEADLERDAEKWRHAAEARGQGRASRLAPNLDRRPKSRSFMRARIAALLVRGAAADG
jgi:hypothetical protein